MRITSLGHAGLLIKTDFHSLLIDPWLSPEGAYSASWFQYPSVAHIQDMDLSYVDAVIVSHEHEDHFDRNLLATLPKTTPLFIPNYPSKYLRGQLEDIGFTEVISLPQWRTAQIGGLSFYFVNEFSPMNHDAAVVISDSTHSVVDLNDARLSTQQLAGIKEKNGSVDVTFYQSTGASWHPMCYDYDPARKLEISRSKAANKLKAATRTINALAPSLAIPFAGPPCFLDDDAIHINSDPYFMDQWEVSRWMKNAGVSESMVMMPGDVLEVRGLTLERDDHWNTFDPALRFDYIADMAVEKRTVIREVKSRYSAPEPLSEKFQDYFTKLMELSPYFIKNISMKVGFNIKGENGGDWIVDFTTRQVYESKEECAYRYSFDSRWLKPLLEGQMRWENFFLSLRFSASRSPDIYCDHLLGLLKFAEFSPLRAVELHESTQSNSEKFIVETGGHRYSIPRSCPHAGSDLSMQSEILPGRVIRCLLHLYEFSLDSGNCLNGNAPPMAVERLDHGVSMNAGVNGSVERSSQ